MFTFVGKSRVHSILVTDPALQIEFGVNHTLPRNYKALWGERERALALCSVAYRTIGSVDWHANYDSFPSSSPPLV